MNFVRLDTTCFFSYTDRFNLILCCNQVRRIRWELRGLGGIALGLREVKITSRSIEQTQDVFLVVLSFRFCYSLFQGLSTTSSLDNRNESVWFRI